MKKLGQGLHHGPDTRFHQRPDDIREGSKGLGAPLVFRAVRDLAGDDCRAQRPFRTLVGRLNPRLPQEAQYVAPVVMPAERKEEFIMPERLRVCYDRILPQDLRRFARLNMMGPSRAAVLKAKKWPNGSTLRVRFIGGNSTQQDIVRQFAPQWTQHANLKLNFTNAPDAEIRISFVDTDGA
jgi:hypothetical protein